MVFSDFGGDKAITITGLRDLRPALDLAMTTYPDAEVFLYYKKTTARKSDEVAKPTKSARKKVVTSDAKDADN